MKIDKYICQKLVESMFRRCETVIATQGGYTEYWPAPYILFHFSTYVLQNCYACDIHIIV